MTPGHGSDEHGGWDALAAGYALSALEPDEETQFVTHLATCARCTETVREATRTVGDLAYVVPDEEPPPALKQRLMAAVAMAQRGAVPPPRPVAEPESPDSADTAGRRPTGEPAAGEPAAGEPAAGEPAAVPFRRRMPRWQRLAAVAAVLAALAGLAGWNVKLRADLHRLQGPARVVALDSNGSRLATLVVRPGTIDVISETMQPSAAGQRYWLWALDSPTDPSPAPIAGFEVRSAGVSVQTVRSSQPGLDQVKDFAVSEEPGGSTPTKPSKVLAAGAASG